MSAEGDPRTYLVDRTAEPAQVAAYPEIPYMGVPVEIIFEGGDQVVVVAAAIEGGVEEELLAEEMVPAEAAGEVAPGDARRGGAAGRLLTEEVIAVVKERYRRSRSLRAMLKRPLRS